MMARYLAGQYKRLRNFSLNGMTPLSPLSISTSPAGSGGSLLPRNQPPESFRSGPPTLTPPNRIKK
jgi:hypothetical protein